MTTHVQHGTDAAAPPDYPQHPPSSAYPTAPPWASAPEPAATPAYQPAPPFAQHGQLLVPFPEEMHNASRPQAPTWWPVVVWTFFLGVLGIVSASRRANQARRGRNTTVPYWAAWGATMAVQSVILVAVAGGGCPPYLNFREGVVTKVVQSDLTNGTQLRESAGVTASSAICDPVGPRDDSGIRLYNCSLALSDGRTGTLMVTADSDGNWTAVPQK